jgi:hypothetical protein
VDPRAGLDDMEKRKFSPYRDSNSDPSVVQPVSSHYTDCTTPANERIRSINKSNDLIGNRTRDLPARSVVPGVIWLAY